MKKITTLISLCCLAFGSMAHAEVSWSWSFKNNSLSAVNAASKPIPIDILVKNDATSNDSLELAGFNFTDGSFPHFGVFVDTKARPVLTLTQLPPPTIALAPGEQVTFNAFVGVASSPTTIQDAVANGDSYLLDPKYYVSVNTPTGSTYFSKQALHPLQVTFAAVPEPSVLYLSSLGLSALVLALIKQKRHASTKELARH